MKLAWLTDIHLNFATREAALSLALQIKESGAEAVLIGGDTAEAASFGPALRRLARDSGVLVYFVLGNHDYYHGSIAAVRQEARSLSREESSLLQWLPGSGVVQVGDHTTLVGHGGWGDGRVGDFLQSGVVLNDYMLIEELRDLHRPDLPPPRSILTPSLLARVGSLGDEAAAHFRRVLPEALEKGERVLVLTHVPPFHEACWHDGRLSNDDWAPHFTCKAVGDVLVEFMSAHPDRSMTVLCGHTHSPGHAQILDNLEVLTGDAVYGQPGIQRMVVVE